MLDHGRLVEADRDDVVATSHPDRQAAWPDDAVDTRPNCSTLQQGVGLEREVQLQHLAGAWVCEFLTDNTSDRVTQRMVRLGVLVKPNQAVTGAHLDALGQNGCGNLRRRLGAAQLGRLSNGSCVGHLVVPFCL